MGCKSSHMQIPALDFCSLNLCDSWTMDDSFNKIYSSIYNNPTDWVFLSEYLFKIKEMKEREDKIKDLV